MKLNQREDTSLTVGKRFALGYNNNGNKVHNVVKQVLEGASREQNELK